MVKLLMLCCLLTFSAVGSGGFYLSNVRSVVEPMITGPTSRRPIDPVAIIKRRSQKAADARDEASRAKPIEVQNNSLQEQQGTQVARAGAKRRSAISRKPVHRKTKSRAVQSGEPLRGSGLARRGLPISPTAIDLAEIARAHLRFSTIL
jgi:hypothetical protein